MENSGKNKRGKILFVIIIIVAGVLGGAASILEKYLRDRGTDLPGAARAIVSGMWKEITIFAVVSTLVWIGVVIYFYLKSARLERSIDPDDDESAVLLSGNISKTLLILNTGVPIAFLLNNVTMYAMWITNSHAEGGNGLGWSYFAVLALFVAVVVVYYIIARGNVDMQMRLDPARRGDVHSIFFHKQWEETSDEAQKIILYKSGYDAYIVMLHVTVLLEVISMVTMEMFHTGILPSVYIFVIWITGQFVNDYKQYKMEKA